MRTDETAPPRYFIHALSKGLTCLEAFTGERGGLTLSQISRHLNTNTATATRLCRTLADLGFLRRSDDKKFHVTPRVLRLGYSYVSSLPKSRLIHQSLEELSARVLGTVNLAVLEQAEIVYLMRIARRDHTPFEIRTGTRLPAHCTAMGKAILAFSPPEFVAAMLPKMTLRSLTRKTITDRTDFARELEAIRAKGFAWSDEELSIGNLSVAAPICDRCGHAIAAVNVGTSTEDYTLQRLIETAVPQVIETAAQISVALQTLEDPFQLGTRYGV
ncbi:MAG: IclR family transcriptional regulator C-terminal domain-containing protein [Candidatus Methylomirabilota bacterium]